MKTYLFILELDKINRNSIPHKNVHCMLYETSNDVYQYHYCFSLIIKTLNDIKITVSINSEPFEYFVELCKDVKRE